MKTLKGNAVIAQGGGPTAVINQSLVGAILQSRKHDEIKKFLGAVNGIQGIINNKFINLDKLSEASLATLAKTPSSALLSTRDKANKKYCKKIIDIFKKKDVRYFFYIGGNDTANTLQIIEKYAKDADYKLHTVHIPKTIDNDIAVTDHTPGFGSAARFVAQAFIGLDLDNKALGGIYMGIVMGRNSGFLTAASALARLQTNQKGKPEIEENRGPHLIYLPERKFKMQDFIQDLKKQLKKHGRCTVAISEGIKDSEGNSIAQNLSQDLLDKDLEKDPHGNSCLSNISLNDLLTTTLQKEFPDIRIRGDKLGYLQRSFPEVTSSTDRLEARKVGEFAIKHAVENQKSGSVTLHRKESLGLNAARQKANTQYYQIELKLTELKEVSDQTKKMPPEFINKSGNNITQKFIDYARPLIGDSLPEIEILVN